MKIKILMFPLIVVAILILAIWVIPVKNGAIKIMQAKLDAANEKLSSIEEKQRNANSLLENLNNNAEYQKTIIEYLPEKKQDEYMVASINSLAETNGVIISMMNFSENSAMQPVSMAYDDLGVEIPVETDVMKEIAMTMDLSGSYERIRNFLFSLSAIKRLNRFNTLTIAKGSEEAPDVLSAKMGMVFGYMDKMENNGSLRESFFASGKFDADIVNDIHKKATIEIPKIDIGDIGRGNIFAL